MNKISVLIPDGDDDRALIVVRGFSYSKNVKVHALASKKSNLFLSRHCKTHRFDFDKDNYDARLERVIQISKAHNIDILFPIGELGTMFIIFNFEVLQKLFLIPPIPKMDALNIVSDKWLLSEFSKTSSLPYPRTFPIEKETDIKSLDLSYPILLKPRLGAGGIGIEFIDSEVKLLSVLENEEGEKYCGKYIIQEYVEGEDIDMSVLCLNGEILAYTIQQPIKKEKSSFSFGKLIELKDDAEIYGLGNTLFSSLNWSGVAHVDFIRDEKKGLTNMIDFNPRYWGTLIGSIVSGVNFPLLACLAAQNKDFARPVLRNSKFAILNIKHLLAWLSGKDYLGEIPFSQTNLKYLISDPLPALRI